MYVRPLFQEDPLEEVMAIHSSILAWRMPWREEPGGLQSIVSMMLEMEKEQTLSATSEAPLTPSTSQPGIRTAVMHTLLLM